MTLKPKHLSLFEIGVAPMWDGIVHRSINSVSLSHSQTESHTVSNLLASAKFQATFSLLFYCVTTDASNRLLIFSAHQTMVI